VTASPPQRRGPAHPPPPDPARPPPPDPGRRLVREGRIALVRPDERDRDEFLAAVASSRELHGRWVDAADTAPRFEAYLRRVGRPDTAGWLIRVRASGALAGVVNINAMVWGSLCSGHLGYYGFAGTAGRGYVTEGVALAVREAFEHLHLHRVEAAVQPGNAPSAALVRRLGFRHEGLSRRYMLVGGAWRDHDRWALTVEDAHRLPTPGDPH
jgi:ribosomal-protein-alanine N-acetyltransferase